MTKHIEDPTDSFFAWCVEVDPDFASVLKTTKGTYERFCAFAEKHKIAPPNIEHTIKFSIARIKLEYELAHRK